MTKEPFIAHSELTNEIYIICGTKKYIVTKQVIKAMQNTGRLDQPSGLHWIERFDNEDKWLECPYCHISSDNAYNYCPNCGACFK